MSLSIANEPAKPEMIQLDNSTAVMEHQFFFCPLVIIFCKNAFYIFLVSRFQYGKIKTMALINQHHFHVPK